MVKDQTNSAYPLAVITQPNYLPWVGYFEQIERADLFVFLNNVQYEKREWQNRNRIRTASGETLWLTVPVKTKGCYHQLIREVEIDDSADWRRKHLNSILHHYRKTPFFESVYSMIEKCLGENLVLLCDLNILLIKTFAHYLGLTPRYFLASEIEGEGIRTSLLVDLCQKVGAKSYYSSIGAKIYMAEDEHLFEERGIRISYQDFQPAIYPQTGEGFISHLSIVDLLFNRGPESRKYLNASPTTLTKP